MMVNEELEPTGESAEIGIAEPDFTAGEWEVKESKVPGYERTIDVVAGDLRICEVTGGGVSNLLVLAQVRANARLLAAAKALYKAARRAEEAIASLPDDALGRDAAHGYFYKHELLAQVRAALALVDGPQNQETE